MPDLAALRPGDPATVGEYGLTGRLGEGGQGIVYLATGPDGTKVALKLLRSDLAGDAEASERFVREVAMARRVAPFCTAQVIETGLFTGRPYIVSEYIDGPTLTNVVRLQGPREGASLHRLAIGTITALVAIHQAGIVHRDFKPSNVVLASDGPRVIDFGIARALDLTSTLTGTAIGTPSFMAPEQLTESSPGPQADLFAWACTLLFAASGQPPFGQDSLPAVVNRIMHTEADVRSIQDPALRALVTDCLAKDPARRPTASEALMRLLGHAPATQPGTQSGTWPGAQPGSRPGTPSGAWPAAHPGTQPGAPFGTPAVQPDAASQPLGLLQEGSAAAASGPVRPAYPPPPIRPGAFHPGPPTRPARKKATGWIVAASIAGALTLAATSAFVAVRLAALPDGPTEPTTATSTPATSPSPTPTPTPSPTLTSRSIALPGTSVKLEEKDGDPIRLASYTRDGGKRLYVRKHATGTFTPDTRYFEYALDPGTNQALGTDVDYSTDYYSTVSIIDHVTGRKRVVKLSPKPVYPTTPRWSPDGKHGLVTLYRGTEGNTSEYGYGIIDTTTGKGRVFPVREQGAGVWRFFWDAGGRAVGTWVGGKMKFYDLNGKLVRTLSNVGTPVWVEGDDISPSGTRFLAHCTSAGTTLCARSTAGDDTAPITIPFRSDRLIGWWDDDHLAVWRTKGAGYEAVVIDMSGKVDRVLATAARKAEFGKMGFRFSRTAP
ncbi:Serine/threonine protein kinase [Nonomuraea solani]|uniref:Serine/threonine protein kinase n=1 Tax=Nonomuraea solani TaxID=1144553 RepID=A0A1H6DHV1_9ACTN|nr:serine/threonine-protein kinase [Nonomuraea solani]SEG85017.1 Serine/threonine protein kinase [Nonomuraea solani]